MSAAPAKRAAGEPTAAQKRLMRQAGAASVGVAATLIGLKAWAWFATDSVSLLSSLADSLLDLIASLITFFALTVAMEPADREHRFGHGKSEAVAGLLQAVIVTGSAVFVAVRAVSRLASPEQIERVAAGYSVMAVSLVLSALLVAFQRHVVAKTGSLAVSADSVHYKADLLTNTGVLAALFLSHQLGWRTADPLIALAIVVLILLSVRTISIEALDVLLDRELPGSVREDIRRIAGRHPQVLGVHDIRTRASGAHHWFLQFHLELDPALTLAEVHTISDAIERDVRRKFPAAEVLIHADPHGLDEPRDAF